MSKDRLTKNRALAKRVFTTNYTSQRLWTESLLTHDLISPNASIMNISSLYANLKFLKDKEMVKCFQHARDLSEIDLIMEKYLDKVEGEESLVRSMVKTPDYMFSKLFFLYYTKLASIQNEAILEGGIKVENI